MNSKRSFLGWYFGTNLLLRIMLGLILGAIVGLVFGDGVMFLKPFGDLFIRLLKMIVVPVIFFSLITGSASIDPSRLGRVGIKIFLYYMITSAFAVAIGLGFAWLFQPGLGLKLESSVAGAVLAIKESPGVISILLSIVPTNPFESLAKAEVLPIIFFSCIFGVALSYLQHSENKKIKSNAETLFRCCEGCAEVIYKLVGGILEYAPIGIFSLIAVVFAQQGLKVIGPLGMTTVAIYLALMAQLLIYGVILTINKFSFIRFLNGAKEAIITAFVSRSSNGTLPVSLRNMEDNMGVSRSISAFTLPLGATINMNGTAIYLGICSFFISNVIGSPLTFQQMAIVVLTSTLAAIGTAGVPGAGAIMLIMVLDSVGLTLAEGSAVAAAYGMILGIDAILDMGRTSMNVAGDLVGTLIVAKSENEIDMSKWSDATSKKS